MNVVVLSGKGGTGKTLVATNLSVYMNANYIDADVEEPNGFIFLKPSVVKRSNVLVDVPSIDKEKCEKSFLCVDFCKFNALAKTNKGVIIFDKLCHSCGGCKIVCKNEAIEYKKKIVGVIEESKKNEIYYKRGILKIGEPMAVSIIEKLLQKKYQKLTFVDSSPGTSCNVVSILNYSDAVILITEPTKFGLHDLKRAIKLVERLNIPFGIIINRVEEENNIIKKYCEKNNIKILGQIKYDKDIAKIYSRGELLIKEDKYKNIFKLLSEDIKEYLLCK